MHIISRKALREFWETHPDAELPLRQWEAIVRRAEWRDWADLKVTYGSADKVDWNDPRWPGRSVDQLAL
jgi:mRNA interferase HigB